MLLLGLVLIRHFVIEKSPKINGLISVKFVVNQKDHENCRIRLLVVVVCRKLKQNRKSDDDDDDADNNFCSERRKLETVKLTVYKHKPR